MGFRDPLAPPSCAGAACADMLPSPFTLARLRAAPLGRRVAIAWQSLEQIPQRSPDAVEALAFDQVQRLPACDDHDVQARGKPLRLAREGLAHEPFDPVALHSATHPAR